MKIEGLTGFEFIVAFATLFLSSAFIIMLSREFFEIMLSLLFIAGIVGSTIKLERNSIYLQRYNLKFKHPKK